MAELWKILFPILITDVMNPILFAFLVYAASTNHPILNSSACLLGLVGVALLTDAIHYFATGESLF